MLTLAAILEFLSALSESATTEERAAALNEHIQTALVELDATAQVEALAALQAEIVEATNAQLDGDRTSDQALANLTAFGEINAVASATATAIEAEQTERETRAAELAEQILGQPAADGGDGETEDAPAEGDDEAAQPGEGGTTEDAPAEGETTDAAVPVAAAAAPAPRAVRANARRPQAALPVVANAAHQPGALPSDIANWGLTAGANVEGMTHGQRVTNQDQLAQMFVAAIRAGAGYNGGRVDVPLLQLGGSPEAVGYGEERILREGDLRGNMRKIRAAATPEGIVAAARAQGMTPMQALAAAGGICAPLPVTYDEPMIGTDARPVRDQMLTRFGADRGGVNLFPALHFEDMLGATGFWTNANDISPGSDGPTVKPCLTMTCPEDEAFLIYAVTQCMEIGVFRSKYFSEQVEAWIRGAAIAGARAAEVRLIEQIGDSSTQVTASQIHGTIPTILAALDHAVAVIRYSNRLDRALPMRWGIPSWLIENIRIDEARRLPGSGTLDEKYALAESKIMGWFRERNVEPTLMIDGETGQGFNRQGDGPVQGFPSIAKTYLYPDGSHLFLDGGELNIGVVRDADLVAKNSYRIFSETMEGHAFHGVESWAYDIDICPDGNIQGAQDIDPCSTGS